MNPVTDPTLLAQLNGPTPVTDPAILAQLNGQPTAQQQAMGSTAGRFTTGAVEPIMGIGQLVPRGISEASSLGGMFPNPVSRAAEASAARVDRGANQLERTYSDARTATGQSGFDWAKLAGNILSPASLSLGTGAGALPEAASLGGRLAQGLGVGAAYGASAPVNTSNGGYAGQKVMQTGAGALLGAAAPAAGEIASRALYPHVTDAARLLMNEGVRVPVGLPKTIQDRLSSFIPTVSSAQARSMEDLNTAVANRALNPIGESAPAGVTGRALVDHVKKTLGNAYDTLLPKLTGQNDAGFQQGIGGIRSMAAAPGALPEQLQATLNGVLDREINSRISPNGGITGQALKDMQTGIGNKISEFAGSQDPFHKVVLGGLKEADSQIKQMIGRTNPAHAEQLSKIDEGYANYARLRTAAGYQGADATTGFTPGQLSSAVRAGDKTVGHGGFASGNAYMQDLSDAAKSTLPNKYPDSGTAGRLAAGWLAGGGATAAMGHPVGAALGAAATALYSTPGQAMARALMKRPDVLEPVAQDVAKYSNPAALARLLSGQ